MSAAEMQALGEHVIMPICFFGFLAWLVWTAGRDE